MTRIFIISILMLQSFVIKAQQAIQVYHNQQYTFFSAYWQDSLTFEVAVPDVLYFTRTNQSFPLLILFDQQNRTGFEYHLQGINLLHGVGAQIPGILIAGLPFDPQKRLQLTDTEIYKDGLNGLECTANLIFNELIPLIGNEIAPVSFLMVAGHSRTAWLVNYLLANYPERISAAGSFSGFFESDDVKTQLLNLVSKSDTNMVYYLMTSGESFEEQPYLESNNSMADAFEKLLVKEAFKWEMEVFPAANHITNYALSVPVFLTRFFSDYNQIMGEWFEWKQDSLHGIQAAQELENDFINLPYPLSPQLVHIYSLASHYFNQNDYQTAICFIETGLKYYPKEPGLKLFEAELYALSGDSSRAKQLLIEYDELIKNPAIKPDEKAELNDWYESVMLELKE